MYGNTPKYALRNFQRLNGERGVPNASKGARANREGRFCFDTKTSLVSSHVKGGKSNQKNGTERSEYRLVWCRRTLDTSRRKTRLGKRAGGDFRKKVFRGKIRTKKYPLLHFCHAANGSPLPCYGERGGGDRGWCFVVVI